jgi:hypothetical protein
MEFFILKDGERNGPYDAAAMAGLIRDGDVTGETKIWQKGYLEWTSASEIPGLFLPPPVEKPYRKNREIADRLEMGEALAESSLQESRSLPNQASPRPRTARWNFLALHWRGQLSLAVSYWLMGMLVAPVIAVILLGLVSTLHGEYDPRKSLAVVVLGASIYWSVTFWSIVGTWRAATNHIERTGRTAWARAAQVACVLGLLKALAAYSTDLHPKLALLMELAFVNDPLGSFQVRSLRGGQELELSGNIVFGAADSVSRALAANPNVSTIHLNSGGGRIGEALKLASLIERHRIITYTSKECASACTIAFAAGAQRLVLPNARVGFHRPSLNQASASELAETARQVEAFLISRGVDPRFARRSVETPSDSMWYPTRDELLRAKVITAVAPVGQFSLSGITAAQLDRVEQDLLRLPLFKAIQEFEPDLFEKSVSEMRGGFLVGRTMEELRTRMLPILQKILFAELPKASDQAVREMARIFIAQARVVKAKAGDKCFEFMQGGSSISVSALVGGDLQQQEMRMMADVIRTARTSPKPAFSEGTATRYLDLIVKKLERRYGTAALVLLEPDEGRKQKQASCDITVAMYEEILKLSEAQSGPLLRYLFSGLSASVEPSSARQ